MRLPQTLGLLLAIPCGWLAPTAWADPASCRPLLEQAQQLLAEAEQQAQQGRGAKAEGLALRGLGLIDRAATLCPGDIDVPNLGVMLAAFARDAQRGQAWLARYEALAAHGERDPQLHYLRAMVEVRLVGRPDLAVRSLERMQALAPGLFTGPRDSLYYEALLGHGLLLAVDGRHAEALRLQGAAESLARRTGKPARARRARAASGITLSQAERYAEAASIFRSLRQEDPLNPIWPFQLGLSLAHMFDYDAAITAYRESLALQPGWQDQEQILADLARARLRLGNCLRLKAGSLTASPARDALVEEALAELTRYHAERPKDALGALWIGVLYYEEKDRPLEALGWFERAFALDPECPTTIDHMLQAHARAGAPVAPEQPLPGPAEMAAWQAKANAWRKDKEQHAERRKQVLAERVRITGDDSGGCL